jgi:predicted O-methyltransferase YrrM
VTNRVVPFVPTELWTPHHLVDVPTAWEACPPILRDIMLRFKIKPNTALEFGVDYGYSAAALANFFNRVIAVDTFKGDEYAGYRDDTLMAQTERALKDFKNIELVQSDYRDFIKQDHGMFDAIHIDVIHNYQETNECLAWSVNHSDVVLVHDTISFPEVRRAVQDVCWETGVVFYEYQVKHGLGILVRE